MVVEITISRLLASVIVVRRLFPKVGLNLVAGCLPPVALLHTLTRLAGEQFGFSDAVVEIFHCATMTAVRSPVNAEVTASLQRSTVRIEVHVTKLPQGASSYFKAEDAGI